MCHISNPHNRVLHVILVVLCSDVLLLYAAGECNPLPHVTGFYLSSWPRLQLEPGGFWRPDGAPAMLKPRPKPFPDRQKCKFLQCQSSIKALQAFWNHTLHQPRRGANCLQQQRTWEARAAAARRGFRSCRSSSGQSGLGEAEAKLQWRRERLRTARPVPNLVLSTSTEGIVKLSKTVFLQSSKAFFWHLFSKLVHFRPVRSGIVRIQRPLSTILKNISRGRERHCTSLEAFSFYSVFL